MNPWLLADRKSHDVTTDIACPGSSVTICGPNGVRTFKADRVELRGVALQDVEKSWQRGTVTYDSPQAYRLTIWGDFGAFDEDVIVGLHQVSLNGKDLLPAVGD